MKKIITFFFCVIISIVTMSAQVRFSVNANVYSQNNNQRIGEQYIAANIDNSGSGTMTLGTLTLKAVITNIKRDVVYGMTAYSVVLYSERGQTVDAVMTIRDKGSYTVLVYYGDGTLRYDFYPKNNI